MALGSMLIRAALAAACVGATASPARPQTSPAPGDDLRLVPYLEGLTQPVGLVPHPTDPAIHFVVEKGGRVIVVERGTPRPEPFLDLRGAVAGGGEQGLLGLAFDPEYATSGRCWANFTRASDGATVIARFTRDPINPWRVDPATRLDLRFAENPARRAIAQPAGNHNGGKLWFGPDGFLYVAMGDGGGGNDQFRQAQDPASLLGKILRLDVDVPDVSGAPLEARADAERGYRVPPDNPFVDGIPVPARPEIWAFGVRNPWRVTVDAPGLGGTGALLIADVGQGAREEISYEPAGHGGRNYGWPLFEGTRANTDAPMGVVPAFTPLVPPLFEYPRSAGISITGGHVYRGTLLGEAMHGRYVFGDLSNRLYSLGLHSRAAPGAPVVVEADQTAVDHTGVVGSLSGGLVSIDADLQGELYLVTLSGSILRLTTTADADGNGLADEWERAFGLPALGEAEGGPFGDPDGDGSINAEEFRRGTHPTGAPVGWLAEGATGFFETVITVLNDGLEPVSANVSFETADGLRRGRPMAIGAERVARLDVGGVAGLRHAEFVSRVEATRPVTAAREMRWPADGPAYGSHTERVVPAPSTVWHFAEGATTRFELFYLLQNTSPDTDASVEIAWRVQGRGTDRRAVVVPAGRRVTIWVNQEPGLGDAELGATVVSTNGVPLVVERAMYARGAPLFASGHAAAGEPAPAPRWFFAEGATGSYFDTFLAVVNPQDQPLDVHAEVYLQDGTTQAAPKTFTTRVGGGERGTIWLDQVVADDGTSLDGQGGLAVALSASAPFVAERVMWWPGDVSTWHEAHAAAGFAEPPGAVWRVAGGTVTTGASGAGTDETYLLIANVGAAAARADVRIYFVDRAPVSRRVDVPARSRLTLPVHALATEAFVPGVRTPIGIRITADDPGAALYVEQAVYGTPPGGPQWSTGSAHRAGQ